MIESKCMFHIINISNFFDNSAKRSVAEQILFHLRADCVIDRKMIFLNPERFLCRDMDDAIGISCTFSISFACEENPFDSQTAGNFESVQDILSISGSGDTEDTIAFGAHSEELLGITEHGIHIIGKRS